MKSSGRSVVVASLLLACITAVPVVEAKGLTNLLIGGGIGYALGSIASQPAPAQQAPAPQPVTPHSVIVCYSIDGATCRVEVDNGWKGTTRKSISVAEFARMAGYTKVFRQYPADNSHIGIEVGN